MDYRPFELANEQCKPKHFGPPTALQRRLVRDAVYRSQTTEHAMQDNPERLSSMGATLSALLLLLLALAGFFAQFAAVRGLPVPLPLVVLLRLALQALLVAAAVGLLYRGPGCLWVAVFGLGASIVGEGLWLGLGYSDGIGVGTFLAAALLVVFAWRLALHRRTARQAERV